MKLPETIQYDNQPYTYGAVLGSLQWGQDSRGRRVLTGVVVSGTETSRLFHHTATRDISGRRVCLYGVDDDDIRRGHIVQINCG